MIIRGGERAARWLLDAWRALSLDAKIVGTVAIANWLLLFTNHTTVAATSDETIWRLFPGVAGPAFLAVAGLVAFSYPFRDRRQGVSFTPRGRWVHLAVIIAVFVVVPTIASIVLAFVNDVPPKVAIDQARRGVGTESRPSRTELDQLFKDAEAA